MTDQYFLSHGQHLTPEAGRCAMEWVSYLAGEEHSDTPRCVSQALRYFCILLNDRLGDENRQKLRPYLARTIGTANDGMDPARHKMCREWLDQRNLGVAPWYDAVIAAGGLDVPVEEALELLDRMLPTEPIQLPVVADAALVCG